jgi:hypothetical protein
VARDHFPKRCGVFDELANGHTLPRTSNNASPVIDNLKAFALNTLSGGKRFAHAG